MLKLDNIFKINLKF